MEKKIPLYFKNTKSVIFVSLKQFKMFYRFKNFNIFLQNKLNAIR